MSKNSNNITAVSSNLPVVTPGEIPAIVEMMYHAKRPMMLWGPPGVGKSDTVRQAAVILGEQLDDGPFGLIDVRCSQLDPVDFRGVPAVFTHAERMKQEISANDIFDQYGISLQGKRSNEEIVRRYEEEISRCGNQSTTEWAYPDFLPQVHRDGKNGILFLDEIASAKQDVQAAAYQLILDRRIGSYTLPDGWVVIAAGNRAEDKAITFEMSSALNNRFAHIDVEASFDDWKDWAYKSNIHEDVISFLSYQNGKYLYSFDPDSESKAFATPRSWGFASTIIQTAANNGSKSMINVLGKSICACIGAAIGQQFLAFRSLRSALPDIDKIIENWNTSGYNWPKNNGQNIKAKDSLGKEHEFSPVSLMYIMAIGIASRADNKNAKTIWKIAKDMAKKENGHADISTVLVVDAMRKNKSAMVSCDKEFEDWCVEHLDIVTSVLN